MVTNCVSKRFDKLTSTSRTMDGTNKCRCCLMEGLHKDLNTPYISMNNTEIYGQMLGECFNVQLLSSPYISNSICDSCIKCLRAAVEFKHQVLLAEDVIIKIINKDDEDTENIMNMNVKLEPDEYCIDSEDLDSDDYPIAQTIKPEADNQMQLEARSEGSKNNKSSLQVTKQGGGGIKIKFKKTGSRKPSVTLNAIGVPINLPEITFTKKEDKKNISVKKSKSSYVRWKKTKLILLDKKDSLIEVIDKTKTDKDRMKRKYNLETVIENTNVTPFTKPIAYKGYKCVFCRKTFDSADILRNHTRHNHKKNKHLGTASVFINNGYTAKVDIKDLSCTLCGEKFDSISNVTVHLNKTHDIKYYFDVKDHIFPYKLDKVNNLFECALCTSTYETYKMYAVHMNVHYANYVCDICGAAFATQRSKAVHDKIHVSDSCACKTCGKVFRNQARLQYHSKLRHQDEQVAVYRCTECGISFTNHYQRNSHMIKVHNAEAYKCNVCNRAFPLKTRLMYHVKNHHLKEKNVVCPECGKRFFNNGLLKDHMLKHTGEKNFVCAICNKAYGRRYTLREHMRIHNNDRRFKCDVCQMMFVQKCSLRGHLLSNHGISMQASEISVNTESKARGKK